MLLFKQGVSLRGLEPQLVVAIQVAECVFREEFGAPCVVTSVNDSVHSTNSYHYLGRAFDLRTKHLLFGQAEAAAARLRDILGPLGFDVLLEDLGGDDEHIHLELDRRSGY